MKKDNLLMLFGILLSSACFLAVFAGEIEYAIFFAVIDIHVYLWRKMP